MKKKLRYIHIAVRLLVFVVLLLASFSIAANLRLFPFPYSLFAVQTKSMYPFFMQGDLVLTKKTDTKELKAGDIIIFERPGYKENIILHRIKEIKGDEFITKGDNNAVEDPSPVSSEQVIGKYVRKYENLGNAIIFIKKPLGLFIFVILPALYLIGLEIVYLINHWVDHKVKKKLKPDSVTSIM